MSDMQIQIRSKVAFLSGLALLAAAFYIPAHAATNTAPVISGTPALTTTAGQLYNFQPSASDVDGNALSFSVTSKPAWARLDKATGRFYGTPSNADAGVYEQIEISVSGGMTRTKLPKFSLTVAANPALGQAPSISGTPVTTVMANHAYSFKPNAMDMDGDTLTFSMTGRPAWATLNKQTGELYGTPTSAQVGVYSNVEISVSDGINRKTLPKFSVTVNPDAPVTKSVALSWTPPTMNTDGTALTNLSGYRIVYGTQSGNYTQSISVNTVGLVNYVVDNLAAGQYYFAVVARNSNGTESAPSVEVSVTL
jgi:hypothetical protein